MPQIAQQDYIYIEVDSLESGDFNDSTKRIIANAIDRGCGLDVVLVKKLNEGIVQCRMICAAKTALNGYYIAYWDWDNDSLAYVDFEKPAPEEPTEEPS